MSFPMPAKGKVRGKDNNKLYAAAQRDQKDQIKTEAREEDGQPGDDEGGHAEGGDPSSSDESSGIIPSATGKRSSVATYSFQAETEQKLVEFFETNDCFYNKVSENYGNTARKNRLLRDLARDLKTDTSKILGWFKNQRTAVGKLLKMKSGQSAMKMTFRKRWQLTNFAFLKSHIVPRSYSQDPAELSFTEEDDCAHREDMEVASSASSQPSMSMDERWNRRSQGMNMQDEAPISSWSQPRESEAVAKLSFETATSEERQAFGQWWCSLLPKIPEVRWGEFEDEAFTLIRRYTRVQTTSATVTATTFTSTSMQKQHWHQQQQWLQQQQQWPKQQ